MADITEELFKFNPWWENDFKTKLLTRPKYLEYLTKNLTNRDIILITGLRRIG